jgi:hypothetical protein
VLIVLCNVNATANVAGASAGSEETFAIKVAPLERSKKGRHKSNQSPEAVLLAKERLLYAAHLTNCAHIPRLPLRCYGDDKGYRYLAMQLMSTSLSARLKEVGGAFSYGAVALVAVQAVRHCHCHCRSAAAASSSAAAGVRVVAVAVQLVALHTCGVCGTDAERVHS